MTFEELKNLPKGTLVFVDKLYGYGYVDDKLGLCFVYNTIISDNCVYLVNLESKSEFNVGKWEMGESFDVVTHVSNLHKILYGLE